MRTQSHCQIPGIESIASQAFPVHRQSDARPCHPWKAYPIVTLRSGTQLVSDECAVFLVWADFRLDPLRKQKHAGSISGGSRSGTAKGNCHPKSYTVQGHSLGRHCEAESGWFVSHPSGNRGNMSQDAPQDRRLHVPQGFWGKPPIVAPGSLLSGKLIQCLLRLFKTLAILPSLSLSGVRNKHHTSTQTGDRATPGSSILMSLELLVSCLFKMAATVCAEHAQMVGGHKSR